MAVDPAVGATMIKQQASPTGVVVVDPTGGGIIRYQIDVYDLLAALQRIGCVSTEHY